MCVCVCLCVLCGHTFACVRSCCAHVCACLRVYICVCAGGSLPERESWAHTYIAGGVSTSSLFSACLASFSGDVRRLGLALLDLLLPLSADADVDGGEVTGAGEREGEGEGD